MKMARCSNWEVAAATALASFVWVGCSPESPASRTRSELGTRGAALQAGSRAAVIDEGVLDETAGWVTKSGRGSHVLELSSGLAEVSIFLEHRLSESEARARLAEIAAEQSEASSYFTLDGDEAVERLRYAEPPAPSTGVVERLGALPVITLAVARGDVVLRLEGVFRRAPDVSAREELHRLLAGVSVYDAGDLARAARPNAATGAARRVATGRPLPPEAPPALALPAVGPALLASEGFNDRINAGGGVDAEIEIAVSDDGQHIVVVNNARDYTTSNTYGQSFSPTQGLFGGPPANGDPSIAWAQSGTFYFAYIAFPNGTPQSGGVTGCSTGIHTSTDDGQNFAFQSHAFVSPLTGATVSFPDQEHIAADRVNASSTGDDQIYSVWRDFPAAAPSPTSCCDIRQGGACPAGSNTALGFPTPSIVCSSDGGNAWAARVAAGAGDFPRVTVGPDGFVYVTFMSGNNVMLNKFSSCDTGLVQQPGMPVTVATNVVLANCGAGGIPGLDRCNSGMDSRSPTVAVADDDPNHVFVSYASQSSPTNENVFLQDSTDGGVTWTRPALQLNANATGHRFMSWVCATDDTAFVSWYDMRAGVTGASNDLTDFFGATALRDAGGALVANPEFTISEAQDPLCASGWPAQPRAQANSENCSIQPQLAGACAGSGIRCDFSDCPGAACTCGDFDGDGVQDACQVGNGIPKYGDYNGSACAAGRFYTAWASATAPAGEPQPADIDVFFACPPNADDVNGTFADTTPPFFESVPADIDAITCDIGPLGQAVAFDRCGDGAPTVSNDAPAELEATTTIVTWTATDAAGNSATATQTVTIVDQTPPVITAPPDITTSSCDVSLLVNVGTATATDDCDDLIEITGQVVATNGVPLPVPIDVVGGQVVLGIGTHTIRWTASDGSNTSEALQTVNVGSTIQAGESFLLHDRARVLTVTDEGAAVLNSGSGQTRIGNDALSGDVMSVGPVQVLHRAVVQGNVVSATSVFVETDADVTGTTAVAPVALPGLPPLPAFPAPTGGSFTVNSGVANPAPGSYASGTLNGGTLILDAGDYFFDDLTLNSGTTLRAAPGTRVFVENSLAFRSAFLTPGGAIQPIFLGFAGNQVVIEAPLDGTLVAPNARVELGVGSGLTFTGSFFARIIEVRPDSRLVCLAGSAPPQPPPSVNCFDGIQNDTETDIDCGGPACAGCDVGESCNVASDCASGACNAGVCTAGGGVSAALAISTDWGSGYCAVLTVTNASATPTSDWLVTLDLGASTIYTSWNAERTGVTGVLELSPAFSWNQVISPGESTNSVGFCADRAVPGVLPTLLSASATF